MLPDREKRIGSADIKTDKHFRFKSLQGYGAIYIRIINFLKDSMISRELTTEFQTICKEEFGIEMTPEKAGSVGGALLKYIQLLTKMSEENILEEEDQNEKQQYNQTSSNN